MALLLYCILCRIAGGNFELIAKQIDQLGALSSRFEVSEQIAYRLQLWKRQHSAAFELTDQLNRFFGFILLLQVGTLFVSIVNLSFIMLANFYDSFVFLILVGVYLEYFLSLWFIAYFADNIRTQIIQIKTPLPLKMSKKPKHFYFLFFQAFEIGRSLLRLGLKYSTHDRQVK